MVFLTYLDRLLDCGQPIALAIEDTLAEVPVDYGGIGRTCIRHTAEGTDGWGDGAEHAGHGRPVFAGIWYEFTGGDGDGDGAGNGLGNPDGSGGGPCSGCFLPGEF